MTTAQTVKTSFVETGGVRYAYRRLGPATGIPVIFLHHFRATMDHWDPLLVNLIAEKYPIILFDNAGVGHSSGQIPSSIPEMAQHLITFLKALKIDAVVLFGFSLGGMVALQAALDSEHSLVRKLIISGSGPGRGPNGGQELIDPDPKITNENALGNIQLENMLNLFFYDSDSSRAIGQVWYNRVFERNESTSGEKRADWVQAEGIVAQGTAMAKWSTGGGVYDRLPEIKIPTFVSNGSDDAMIPTQHSFVMSQRLGYAHLHVYPDSGHGHCFQYPETFSSHIIEFIAE